MQGDKPKGDTQAKGTYRFICNHMYECFNSRFKPNIDFCTFNAIFRIISKNKQDSTFYKDCKRLFDFDLSKSSWFYKVLKSDTKAVSSDDDRQKAVDDAVKLLEECERDIGKRIIERQEIYGRTSTLETLINPTKSSETGERRRIIFSPVTKGIADECLEDMQIKKDLLKTAGYTSSVSQNTGATEIYPQQDQIANAADVSNTQQKEEGETINEQQAEEPIDEITNAECQNISTSENQNTQEQNEKMNANNNSTNKPMVMEQQDNEEESCSEKEVDIASEIVEIPDEYFLQPSILFRDLPLVGEHKIRCSDILEDVASLTAKTVNPMGIIQICQPQGQTVEPSKCNFLLHFISIYEATYFMCRLETFIEKIGTQNLSEKDAKFNSSDIEICERRTALQKSAVYIYTNKQNLDQHFVSSSEQSVPQSQNQQVYRDQRRENTYRNRGPGGNLTSGLRTQYNMQKNNDRSGYQNYPRQQYGQIYPQPTPYSDYYTQYAPPVMGFGTVQQMPQVPQMQQVAQIPQIQQNTQQQPAQIQPTQQQQQQQQQQAHQSQKPQRVFDNKYTTMVKLTGVASSGILCISDTPIAEYEQRGDLSSIFVNKATPTTIILEFKDTKLNGLFYRKCIEESKAGKLQFTFTNYFKTNFSPDDDYRTDYIKYIKPNGSTTWEILHRN